MTAVTGTVLLVDDDASALLRFREILCRIQGLQVETAADGVEGLKLAQRIGPDLIVSDYKMPVMDGFEFCQRVKNDPALESTMFVVLTGFTDTALKVRGLQLGVDDYLTKPIELAELTAKVHATLRIKRLHDRLRDEKVKIQDLHDAMEQSFEGLLALLIHLLDLGLPGAAERGRRLAKLALDLADRFEVPPTLRKDLELAALLHELGRVVSHGEKASDDWQYAVVSSTLLEDVPRLAGASELVGAIYENWDGTGRPGHRQQGQIPLRSRLLRAGIDFTSATQSTGAAPAEVMGIMRERAGTWYDPVAINHLESIVLDVPAEEWRTTRMNLPVEDIKEGMVLASDLCTSSGIKLLSQGSRITRGTLEVIQRRHQVDPIIAGVWVRK